ncbi:xylan 1,4-beta-xylosidase [Isoptericola jiangsuensis]|uniref:Xylan 1,4-beta-xylosidase n=1 Tax=Isoptericola jiangsuensis TaxID=548579 RepID=A0A2A9ETS8_9MICO|nr:xylan 1,4-beta-xylosidase [Isoptericola jiangsuensis]PFG41976.1 xylan 1,4-beta-xylosidase [Isoptericola jiangsuensis]
MSTIVVPSVPTGVLGDAWRRCVGTGRLNLALRADYQESLALVQSEIGFEYVRGHGLLSDDLGIHRPYDAGGHRGTRYSFTYADQVLDSWLERGIRPFLELGFMPSGLASGDQTVFWWKGNVTPPRDHGEWAALVQAVVRHAIDRYGLDEVRRWPIEVWNEPNLVNFWQDASQEAYFRLYEVTAAAVKEVDAELQVGGPAISPGADEWWAPFADFVTDRDVPVDFLSFHAYTTGPAQHVPFGTYQTLRDPQSLLDQFAMPAKLLAGSRLEGLPTHVTEFSTSYRPDNPVHDTPYQAASLAPVLAGGGDLVDSFSYWTFCDVFEEEGVPAAALHGGFGLLGHRQLRKPAYHLYTFMARMGQDVLHRGADHLVTRDDAGRVTVLAWQPVGGTDAPEEPERHELRLSVPLAGADRASVHRSRVAPDQGDVLGAWRHLGRPASPTARQLDLLHEASEPVRSLSSLDVVDGRVTLDLTLARHEVTLVEIDPVRDETPAWLDDARIVGPRAAQGV